MIARRGRPAIGALPDRSPTPTLNRAPIPHPDPCVGAHPDRPPGDSLRVGSGSDQGVTRCGDDRRDAR
ncbi:unannotated protein [freshwater metagenome]|uniref:Unannotated protein n=1 Tax=freshwater metagenome TaxID=449393 RepID=A0A6J6CBL4_9ZZZZ